MNNPFLWLNLIELSWLQQKESLSNQKLEKIKWMDPTKYDCLFEDMAYLRAINNRKNFQN